MPTLLHIDSSPMGEASISRCLTREFVQRWRSANPRGKVISRDLTAIAIPVIDTALDLRGTIRPGNRARGNRTTFSRSLQTRPTSERIQAGLYVIGVPNAQIRGPKASTSLQSSADELA